MSPTSYQAALPRVSSQCLAVNIGGVKQCPQSFLNKLFAPDEDCLLFQSADANQRIFQVQEHAQATLQDGSRDHLRDAPKAPVLLILRQNQCDKDQNEK